MSYTWDSLGSDLARIVLWENPPSPVPQQEISVFEDRNPPLGNWGGGFSRGQFSAVQELGGGGGTPGGQTSPLRKPDRGV